MAYDVNKFARLGQLKDLATRVDQRADALEAKVNALEVAGGQPNVIEAVKVNGEALAIAEKVVDILIAAGTSDGSIAVNGKDVTVTGYAALAQALTTLVGEDANKSARTIANEELAKQLVPENAAESMDTLAEIAAWIQEHPEDASAMNKAINDLTALVGTLPEGAVSTTVVDYIAEAINAKAADYYTKTEIDAMAATDEEAAEMLDEVFGATAA